MNHYAILYVGFFFLVVYVVGFTLEALLAYREVRDRLDRLEEFTLGFPREDGVDQKRSIHE